MPPTGGTIPLNQTIEQYQEEQRTAILNSNGFKLAMAGVAIAILTLILLARNYMLEDIPEVRNLQIIPYSYPPVTQRPRILKLNTPIQAVTYELRPPIMTLPPRMPIPPIPPRTHFRTFKYPPPYDAFNKK